MTACHYYAPLDLDDTYYDEGPAACLDNEAYLEYQLVNHELLPEINPAKRPTPIIERKTKRQQRLTPSNLYTKSAAYKNSLKNDPANDPVLRILRQRRTLIKKQRAARLAKELAPKPIKLSFQGVVFCTLHATANGFARRPTVGGLTVGGPKSSK